MNTNKPKLLDVVALLHDIPGEIFLRGQVGTIVEVYPEGYEIEFVDDDGKTIGLKTVRETEIIVLHYNLAEVA